MIHSKNQMIRSMKSYQEGGASDDSCMEEYMGADGKRRKRRKQKCGAGKTKRVFSAGEIAKGAAKVGAGIGAIIGGIKLDKKYGLVDKAKQALGMKKGGTVKRTAKKK
jgi:hypothetical protein